MCWNDLEIARLGFWKSERGKRNGIPVKAGEPYQGGPMINCPFLTRNLFGINYIQTHPHEVQGDTHHTNIFPITITYLAQLINGYVAHNFQD